MTRDQPCPFSSKSRISASTSSAIPRSMVAARGSLVDSASWRHLAIRARIFAISSACFMSAPIRAGSVRSERFGLSVTFGQPLLPSSDISDGRQDLPCGARSGRSRMAETEGFEPSVGVIPLRRFSKPLVSATHPRLRAPKRGL